jgi:hypothetical protein
MAQHLMQQGFWADRRPKQSKRSRFVAELHRVSLVIERSWAGPLFYGLRKQAQQQGVGSAPRPSHTENPLEMGDRVVAVVATHQPKLRAATSEQRAKIVWADQDTATLCQGHDLPWSGGGIEVTTEIRVAIHLMENVIQGIQLQARRAIHPGRSSNKHNYQRAEQHLAMKFT